jgi:hypothetical protein
MFSLDWETDTLTTPVLFIQRCDNSIITLNNIQLWPSYEMDIHNCQLVRVVFPRTLTREQPSQVDTSGCPPTKMVIIVLLTEQRTKSDTFMTTV